MDSHISEETITFNSTPMPSTPEGSDIFEWETVHEVGSGFQRQALDDAGNGLGGSSRLRSAAEACNKKARPPKLVREVRDLQEALRHLSHNSEALQFVLDQKVGRTEFQGACQIMQLALDQKANLDDVKDAERQIDLVDLRNAIKDKADNLVLEQVRDIATSCQLEQCALQQKVHHEGELLHELSGCVAEKAIASEVRAALAEKASYQELHQVNLKMEQKANRSAVQEALKKWWLVLGILSSLFLALTWQQLQIWKLSSQNNMLNHSLDKIIESNTVLIQESSTHTNNGFGILGNTKLIENRDHANGLDIQRFESGNIIDGTYTVELVPPYQNAWIALDATMHTSAGTGLTLCRGKADAILAVKEQVLGFHGSGIEQWIEDVPDDDNEVSLTQNTTVSENGGAAIITNNADTSIVEEAPNGTKVATTTGGVRHQSLQQKRMQSQPCMVVSLAFGKQWGGLTHVVLSFTRDTHGKLGMPDEQIKSVRGQIQWFRQ
jgi:hypothetical protein